MNTSRIDAAIAAARQRDDERERDKTARAAQSYHNLVIETFGLSTCELLDVTVVATSATSAHAMFVVETTGYKLTHERDLDWLLAADRRDLPYQLTLAAIVVKRIWGDGLDDDARALNSDRLLLALDSLRRAQSDDLDF